MRLFGDKLQAARNLYDAHSVRPDRKEAARQSERTLRALFQWTTERINEKISASLIENIFLYYWLRNSVINANVSEHFFQKMERNWEEVVRRIDKCVEGLRLDQ